MVDYNQVILTDESPMLFGKHKGTQMANVPASYLLWLYDQPRCYRSIKRYVQENEQLLREEVKNG